VRCRFITLTLLSISTRAAPAPIEKCGDGPFAALQVPKQGTGPHLQMRAGYVHCGQFLSLLPCERAVPGQT
jgi:hypothetical protein